MVTPPRLRQLLLATTTLLLCSAGPALAAFDPESGSDPANAGAALPNPGVLYNSTSTAPLYATPPATALHGAQYASPLAPVYLPPQPLYPARTQSAAVTAAPAPLPTPAVAAAPVIANNPAFPPVDAATAARAQQELAAQSAPTASATAPITYAPPTVAYAAPVAVPVAVAANAPVSASAPGFIAPAPLFAVPAPAPAGVPEAIAVATPIPVSVPAVSPAPMALHAPAPAVIAVPVATPVVASADAPAPLTNQSKTILSHIPSRIDTPVTPPTSKLALNRVNSSVDGVLGKDSKVDTYKTTGLSIAVRRPGLDTNFELNRAYTALMGGDTDTAIKIYKDIISTEPTNQDALFGLAATYHRQGDIEKARPVYGALLKVNPNHREGLNNFLVLVSDESPEEGLPELVRLEQRNPEFSPIPAQEAIVLDKLGYVDEARNKMLRAIELSPDSLTYKYNLAVMLDRRGNYADAGHLYQMLIEASLHGATVPATVETMQKRLNYITIAMANQNVIPVRNVGG
jgi:Tfp pilus assembly protein PilF